MNDTSESDRDSVESVLRREYQKHRIDEIDGVGEEEDEDSIFVSPVRRKSQIDEICSNVFGSITIDSSEDKVSDDKATSNTSNSVNGTRKLSMSFQEQRLQLAARLRASHTHY